MKLAYVPSFFSEEKSRNWYRPDVNAAMREGIEYGRKRGLKTARELLDLNIAHALVGTDLQNDFRDGGRLPVKGADEVIYRTCIRLIAGTIEDHFGGIIYSLDGHPLSHISYDYNWCDKDGCPLDLSKHGGAAILMLHDEEDCVFKAMAFGKDGPYTVGYYRSRFDPKDTVAYWKHLEKTEQGPIWVFVPHCVLGTDGVDLHPLFAETVAFFCGARSVGPVIITKGQLPNTDWFGPLEPCREDERFPQSGTRRAVIAILKQFETAEFAGISEDFCDYSMKHQVMERLKTTSYISRLRFLTDCTAPIVPNAVHVLEQNAAAAKLGVKFIQHDTPF